jgi:hypothetical protein
MLAQMLLSGAASALINRVVQGGQKHAAEARFSLGNDEPSSKADNESSVQKVFEKYDLSAISPREIDQMAAELKEAGFEDFDFLLTLMTHGEEFTSHLRATLAEAGYEPAPFDPTKSGDLIADIEQQVRIARSLGDPTEHAEDVLRKLQQFQAQGHPDGTAPQMTGPSGRLAESIVLARALGN